MDTISIYINYLLKHSASTTVCAPITNITKFKCESGLDLRYLKVFSVENGFSVNVIDSNISAILLKPESQRTASENDTYSDLFNHYKEQVIYINERVTHFKICPCA